MAFFEKKGCLLCILLYQHVIIWNLKSTMGLLTEPLLLSENTQHTHYSEIVLRTFLVLTPFKVNQLLQVQSK